MSELILLGLRILAVIALYAFLGGTLILLWRSLQQDTLALASRQVKPLDLLVSSPDEEDRLLHFIQGNVAIGRDPDCDCVLTHGTVSARHARLALSVVAPHTTLSLPLDTSDLLLSTMRLRLWRTTIVSLVKRKSRPHLPTLMVPSL